MSFSSQNLRTMQCPSPTGSPAKLAVCRPKKSYRTGTELFLNSRNLVCTTCTSESKSTVKCNYPHVRQAALGYMKLNPTKHKKQKKTVLLLESLFVLPPGFISTLAIEHCVGWKWKDRQKCSQYIFNDPVELKTQLRMQKSHETTGRLRREMD